MKIRPVLPKLGQRFHTGHQPQCGVRVTPFPLKPLKGLEKGAGGNFAAGVYFLRQNVCSVD